MLDFLRWVWNYPGSGRARLDAAINAHNGHGVRVIELRTGKQVASFLDPLPALLSSVDGAPADGLATRRSF